MLLSKAQRTFSARWAATLQHWPSPGIVEEAREIAKLARQQGLSEPELRQAYEAARLVNPEAPGAEQVLGA